MAEISFKSVGELSTDRKFQPTPNETPIGIKTPLQLGQKNDGIFAMHFDIGKQIDDNLRNLILTNWGDRVGFYDFGANLNELTMELTSEAFDLEAMTRIKRAVGKWMSFVELQTFNKTIIGRVQGSNVTQIKMQIIYAVPRLGITNKSLELTFFIAG